MPDSNITLTQIPAPRVSLIDPRTGLMSREWYLFFYNIYTLTGSGQNTASIADLQVGPPDSFAASEFLDIQNELQALGVSSQESTFEAQIADIYTQIQSLEVGPPNTPHLYKTRYGVFSDTTTQTAAAPNTAYAMSYNTTDLSLGVYTGTPSSRVYVDRNSIYNIQFSAQFESTNASTKNVVIWLDRNGSNVANSATKITMKGSGEAYVAAWNFVIRLNAGDYFRLMWSTDDINVAIVAAPATAPAPAVPSVILTVTDNIGE